MAVFFPFHFHDKVRTTFEKQGNLELDDQGDNNVHASLSFQQARLDKYKDGTTRSYHQM